MGLGRTGVTSIASERCCVLESGGWVVSKRGKSKEWLQK